jgi:hypothetical protein
MILTGEINPSSTIPPQDGIRSQAVAGQDSYCFVYYFHEYLVWTRAVQLIFRMLTTAAAK